MKNQAAQKQILVVEDEKPMARALELKLANSGFLPTVVYSGGDALQAIKRGVFSLILLDLMMPGIDGFEVLESLRKSKTKIPVIVLTNLSQADDETRAKDLGAKDFFVKSDTSIATVVNRVQAIVG